MGWGTDEHEGIADGVRADGTYTEGTWRGPQDDAVAVVATCSCGWRSETVHQLGPKPDLGDPARDAWYERHEKAEDQCYREWNDLHFEPLLGYDPETMLVEARDAGGLRHFLNGRPVHASSILELLVDDGLWLRFRYEWAYEAGKPARAHVALGVPDPARDQGVNPVVDFDLPPRAILRWPTRED
jgi:hypothetical protein